MHEGVFNLYEEFSNWLEHLFTQEAFFMKFEKILRIIYCYLYEEIMKEIKKKRQDTVSFTNHQSRFLLRNFLSFLEIFLNEFRKCLISTGDYDYSTEDRNQTVINNHQKIKF